MGQEGDTQPDKSTLVVVWTVWVLVVALSAIPTFCFWMFLVLANGKSGLPSSVTKFDLISAIPVFVAIFAALLLIFKRPFWSLLITVIVPPSTLAVIYFL
jgi:hypothetical protein